MWRWDRLVDAYMEEHRGRGTCEATVVNTAARPALEAIDAKLFTRYVKHWTSPRTVGGSGL